MGYRLGVDLGTTYTSAAVLRPGGVPEVVPLGTRSAAVPTVLFLSPDLGDLLVGEAAERRAVTDPHRVVRHFKRRIGDSTPLLIDPSGERTGAGDYAAHDLAAVAIQWVVARVSEREGARPDGIALAHPATWGPHKKDLIRGALALRGLGDVTLVPEPEAAARTYACSRRLAPRATLAVYDLGGGTFDASLLRPTVEGHFELVGRPHGLPTLGGIDFDDAIFSHVLAAVGPAVAELDTSDPLVVTSLSRLRRECVDAKEALSSDTTTEIPVLLPEIRTNVRLTRGELEAMIAPRVQTTIEMLDLTLGSAGLRPSELTNVVLTGGSSRIPLVAQMLSAHLGAPVSLDRDVDPKAAVAVGAVLALDAASRPALVPFPIVEAPPVDTIPVDVTPVDVTRVDVTPADGRPAAALPLDKAATAAVPATRGADGADLAPVPARPARESPMLSGSDDVRLPSSRSKLRPRRALTLLALTTAIMLGAGVGVSAIVDHPDQGSTATPVKSEGLDMAKPKKKVDKDAATEAGVGRGGATPGGGQAATTQVTHHQPQQGTGPAAGDGAVAAAAAAAGTTSVPASKTEQQAVATRKAATRAAAAPAPRPAVRPAAPVTAEEFEAPAIAFSDAEPADSPAEPADSPAEPAAPSAPEAPAPDAGSSDGSGPSERQPEQQEAAPAAAEPAAPSGFAETAPPEAP